MSAVRITAGGEAYRCPAPARSSRRDSVADLRPQRARPATRRSRRARRRRCGRWSRAVRLRARRRPGPETFARAARRPSPPAADVDRGSHGRRRPLHVAPLAGGALFDRSLSGGDMAARQLGPGRQPVGRRPRRRHGRGAARTARRLRSRSRRVKLPGSTRPGSPCPAHGARRGAGHRRRWRRRGAGRRLSGVTGVERDVAGHRGGRAWRPGEVLPGLRRRRRRRVGRRRYDWSSSAPRRRRPRPQVPRRRVHEVRWCRPSALSRPSTSPLRRGQPAWSSRPRAAADGATLGSCASSAASGSRPGAPRLTGPPASPAGPATATRPAMIRIGAARPAPSQVSRGAVRRGRTLRRAAGGVLGVAAGRPRAPGAPAPAAGPGPRLCPACAARAGGTGPPGAWPGPAPRACRRWAASRPTTGRSARWCSRTRSAGRPGAAPAARRGAGRRRVGPASGATCDVPRAAGAEPARGPVRAAARTRLRLARAAAGQLRRRVCRARVVRRCGHRRRVARPGRPERPARGRRNLAGALRVRGRPPGCCRPVVLVVDDV